MIEASTAVVCACLPMCRTPLQRVWPKLFPSKYGSAGGAQTQTQTEAQNQTQAQIRASGSKRTLRGTDSPNAGVMVGNMNGSAVRLASGPRELSGGMLAGHRGPGGRTLEESEEDFDDLEMQSTGRSRDETDRKGIIGGVVPVRMKGW